MKLTLANGVKVRSEPFGSIVYVSARDSFFALDNAYTKVLQDLNSDSAVGDCNDKRLRRLAGLGIIKGAPQHVGWTVVTPGLVGNFTSVPVDSRPLLVNCFSTAYCPLACAYCYADDVMMPYRFEPEEGTATDPVISMADSVDALVAVVTGGEPLAQPMQAADLLRKLSSTKAVVLDTSGVGDISALVPALVEAQAHLRISLDSTQAEVNDAQRPIRRSFQKRGDSSWALATEALCIAKGEGIHVSVQTVLTTANSSIETLSELRELLVALGVRKWVLHVVVLAGKARSRRSPRATPPSIQFLDELRSFVVETIRQRYPLDIRVTNNNNTPNSVLLIDNRGSLLTESADGTGKITLSHANTDRSVLPDSIRSKVDMVGHYSRYLNCDILRTENS